MTGRYPLSYLDAGGDGRVLIALPSHWMEGVTFAPLAAALAPAWRVVVDNPTGFTSAVQAFLRETSKGHLRGDDERLIVKRTM